MSLFLSIPLWFLLTGLGLAVTALPRRLELWLGRRLGRLTLRLGIFKDRIAKENIDRCLPELSPERRQRLLEANYEHYGILFFEFLHFFSPVPGHYPRYALKISRLINKEAWEKANAKGKGVIFFTAHLGFWEAAPAASGLNGVPITIVTTVLKPRWLHNRITACRASSGVSVALHPGSMPTILRALRKGKAVGFMNDQYANPPMGVPAVFFGMRVNTLAAVGPLAKRTGAAVLPVHALRSADGVIETFFEPELDLGEAKDDGAQATQIIASHVEQWIRRNPEQWLWLHRRFKHATPVAP